MSNVPPRKIELVVFDLGRVMIRLCDGWKHACEKVHVPYQPGLDTPDHPMRKELLKLVFLNETGEIDNDQWASRTAALSGLEVSQILALSRAWLDGPYPGWNELLAQLEKVGVRTACLSNTNAGHWKLMHDEGPNQLPMHRLNYRFASHLIRAHKPDPAIYEHVEQETGIAPCAIAFFDDSPPNVDAARTRGWVAEVIGHPGDPVAQVTEHLCRYGVL